MPATSLRSVLLWIAPACVVCASGLTGALAPQERAQPEARETREEPAVRVQFLEIVTPEVDSKCAALEELHGVKFGERQADLGNARTAPLAGGGLISVRAPMHAAEKPVVRPYILVDDIDSATEAAKAAGGKIAHPPLEIPGRGKFAIYFHGGIEHGLWQN